MDVEVSVSGLQLVKIIDIPSVPMVGNVGPHVDVVTKNVVVSSGRAEVSSEVLVSTSKEVLVEEPITFRRIRG